MTTDKEKAEVARSLAEYLATLFRKMAAQKRREAEILQRMADKWSRRS